MRITRLPSTCTLVDEAHLSQLVRAWQQEVLAQCIAVKVIFLPQKRYRQ